MRVFNSMTSLPTDLRRHWYPLSRSYDLRPGDIVGLHLLGDPVCLYRPLSASTAPAPAVCLADRCAHRSAPLSIGTLRDDGTMLECKYHGWKYASSGSVAHVPALLPGRTPKGRVYKYPTHEVDEFIWIWPGPPEEADISRIPTITPGLRTKDGTWGAPFIVGVDLDVDFAMMVENLLDPAHLPFTHEGTLSQRSKAKPLKMEDVGVVDIGEWAGQPIQQDDSEAARNDVVPMKEPHRSVLALRGTVRSHNDSVEETHFHFVPPCHVILRSRFKRAVWQTMHCIPTRPGHMRLYYCQSRTFFTFFDNFPLVHYFTTRFSHRIIFQDYELLHGQQARLKQGASAWKTPIQVDLLPKMFRTWLRKATPVTIGVERGHDYDVVRRGPWFKGWRPCYQRRKRGSDEHKKDENEDRDMEEVEVEVEDVEDMDGSGCRHDCSVPYDEREGGEVDSEWMIPCQWNVDNSAYTWRRQQSLSRRSY